MKILHLGKYYYPYRGGMESIVQDLCEALVGEGNEVTVLVSNESIAASEEIINGVEIKRIGKIGSLFSQPLTLSMLWEVPSLAKKYDVIHLHYPNPLAELAALFMPKEIPLVITFHSDIIRQKRLMALYSPLQRAILKRATKIIAPTRNHIDCSPILSDYRAKCVEIPYGLNLDDHPPVEKIEKKADEYKEQYGKYALFVGRLVEYKGVEFLIKAAKYFEGNILISGTGPLGDELKNLAHGLGFGNRIHFLGEVTDDTDFWALYKGCHMFVLPSITPNENFGVVQLEAMYWKKPVITTNIKSGVPLVGESGKTSLLVNAMNVEELGKAMTLLFNNEELAYKMGCDGERRYHEFYTLEKYGKAHHRLYDSIVAKDDRLNRESLKKLDHSDEYPME